MKNELNQAFSFICGILAKRWRTRRELELRLEQKGFSAGISRHVLEMMEQYGYIDDQAYSRYWVEKRLGKKGFVLLKQELLDRGVDINLIEDVLAEYGQEAEYLAALRLVKEKEALSGNSCSVSRLAGFLKRRGFSSEVIGKIFWEISERG
ncbi:MAG: Regulatory protein RecX [Pelotomaculum thermopropionicum]|uniref:Regulatory protein RecX n=1 Tax=Pelotomaculum thermopropionicum TaxID=110500 RepID=A0A101HVM9_9FIRM|nr:MAG: Regulatory protein RecX [Pelotomaculum thermopropionicum]